MSGFRQILAFKETLSRIKLKTTLCSNKKAYLLTSEDIKSKLKASLKKDPRNTINKSNCYRDSMIITNSK